MKKIAVSALMLLAAQGCAPQEPITMTAAQQSDFDKVIAGRVAGSPQTCISMRLLQGNKSYGEGVIVFEGLTNSTVYVNRPPAGCPVLTSSRALRTRTTSDQLCRNDIATVFDPVNHIEYGSCGLGDFVPYTRQ